MPKPRKSEPEFETPHGYHRPNYNWMELLKPLTRKDKLNQWNVMPIQYTSKGAAHTAAWRIRKRDVELPAGIWAAKALGCKLYVKYMGKAE